jgi:hypothetical protein
MTLGLGMFKPCFYLQNNRVERLTVPVANYARERGIPVLDRSYVSGIGPDDWLINWDEYNQVFVYGSVHFVKAAKNSQSLAKYMENYENRIFQPSYMGRVPCAFNSEEYIILIAEQIAEHLELMNSGYKCFIKPEFEHKAFNGGVYDIESWQKLGVKPYTLCFVTRVKTILREWRAFLIDKQLVDGCQYMERGKLDIKPGLPEQVKEFIKRIPSYSLPLDCLVIDICENEFGNLFILEFNSIHSSGWYAADVNKVLDAWVEYERKKFTANDESIRSIEPTS